MKKFLSISLTVLLAIVITYAGSGINTYTFCCDDCQTFGVEAIAGDKCCDIHQHQHLGEVGEVEEENDNEGISESSHNHCLLNRLDIDLQDAPTEDSQRLIAIQQIDFHFTILPYLSKVIETDETVTAYVSQTQSPPNLSELVYFSMLETLII